MASRLPIGRTKNRAPPNGLPTPAVASPSSRASVRRATFDEEGFPSAVRVHWSRFKKRLGNGSNVSESLLEITESTGGSEVPHHHHKPAHDNGTADPAVEDDEEVSEVVVENYFTLDGAATKSLTQQSDHGGTPEKSGGSGTHGTHLTDGDSIHERGGLWACFSIFTALRYRFVNTLEHFFFTSFYDPNAEAHYKRETYFQMKGLQLTGTMVLLLNWILICILIPRKTMLLPDKIFYWAISPVILVPLPLMIIYDWPKDHPRIYQPFMTFAVWSYCAYSLLLIQFCGNYNPSEAILQCGTKEWLTIFYYTSAFPVIALFALGQNRFMATVSGILTAALIGSVIRNKSTWIRNLLNFITYMSFLLWIHYQREVAERRLYTIRDRLKVQYRATQKAQVRESKAADSKKRFSSYIFHEVRVPLNTALLAVQNMAASGIFNREDIEYVALEGSLNMMSKVLNDVLDFNRMDSGRFESISKPYAFHKVIKGLLVPLQMAASARGLELLTELDPQIDIVAKTMLWKARGESDEKIAQMLHADADDDDAGLVVGDEHRLRQILTNLASNACKFTPMGGKIFVRTKLLTSGFGTVDQPATAPPKREDDADEDLTATPGLTDDRLRMHDDTPKAIKVPPGQIVIRIEVEDTGVGIRRKDMVDNRLFSPYVQTDLGRFQGGKGTGLGLALSKHIVRLSGGRLGVKSKRNHGSVFWVELAMGVGEKVVAMADFNGKDGIVAESFAISRATTEAFKPPESEGATPSTFHSSDASPRDGIFPPQPPLPQPQPPPPPSQSTHAMRQLMEHSGQIELIPRMDHRLTDNSVLSLSQRSVGVPEGEGSAGPPSPSTSKKSIKGALGGSTLSMTTTTPTPTGRPTAIAMPPPNTDFAPWSTDDSGTVVGSAKPGSEPSSALFNPPLEVLVVDDDTLTRKLMSRMLTRIGCTVETADNGKTALDLAMRAANPFTFVPTSPDSTSKPRRIQTPYAQEADPRYDVIFLDNQMPVMSGVDMVRKLRELKRTDFVVGVTGNALKEDQEEYLEAGVDAVLTKPVAETSLKNCLFAADERRKAVAAKRRGSLPDDSPSETKPP